MHRHLSQLLRALVLLQCLLLPAMAQALDVSRNYYELNTELAYLADPGGQLTIEQLQAQPSRYQFSSSRDSKPSGSFTPIWLKLELTFSEAMLDRQYYLFTRVENLFDIRLYRPDGQGGYREWITGNDYPALSREVDSPRYGFFITPSAQPVTLYLRFVGGPGTSNLPWVLVEEETYLRNTHYIYSFDVASLSAIGALLFFNLCIALSLRKADYLFYSAYVLSVMMALVTLDGLGFYYLWPDTPALNERAMHSFNLLSAALRLLVILSFLGVASFAPRLRRVAIAVLGLLGITFLALNLFGVKGLPPYVPSISWAIGILCGFVVCGYAIKQQVRLALPLLLTLLIPAITAVLQAVLLVGSAPVGVFELQLAKIGFVLHVMMFSLCLAAQMKFETESRLHALHDSLTGLPGTTLLHERFEMVAQLSKRQGWKMAVLFVDLDGFKAINDSRGHAAGDQLLVEVAARIQEDLRGTDTVARIGGDEFAVLLTEFHQDSAVVPMVEKLLSSVAAPYSWEDGEVKISASIGVALFPEQGEDLHHLLKAADTAMYSAKRKGKNTYAIASSRSLAQPGNFGEFRSAATG